MSDQERKVKLPASGSGSSGVNNRTCDNCRKRKIKCVEHEQDPLGRPCEGCSKLQLECTHEYVRKKPGRKNTFALGLKIQDDAIPDHERGTHSHRNGRGAADRKPSISTPGYPSSSSYTPLDPSPHSYHRQSLPSDYRYSTASSSSSNFPLDPTLDSMTFRNLSGAASGSSSRRYNQHHQYTNGASALFDASSLHTPAPSSYASNGRASTPSRQPYSSSFALSPSAIKDPGLNWLDSIFDPSGFSADNGFESALLSGLGGGDGSGGLGGFASDQAQLLSLESPEHLLAAVGSSFSGSNGHGHGNGNGSANAGGSTAASAFLPGGVPGPGGTLGHILNPSAATRREPQLEDVTSWANISHFISLFLQYLYPLEPLVHRPTFAEDLATRRDKRDTDFRALLLSIVAYVISQLPTSRLTNDTFDIDGLKRLQRRCHRTCKALQRTYYGPTNLTQISTIIFDMFYLLSIGLGHTAGARLGQAIQLAFSMGLHSDAKTNALGLDAIEVQLRRRVFWQLYASDKTRAIPGAPMLINDYHSVPSLPEPTDDEFITSQGMFPQPASRTSVLAGFVCLSKIFRILSECFFHHRLVLSDLAVPTVGTDWTVAAEDRLHAVLRFMPAAIQDPNCFPNEAGRRVFAMQRANVLITAAIAKFALYDLRAALHVDEEQLAREREANAREIHSLLMNIPVEDLASNGESVRAKVFHIACALCTQTGATEADQELIRDWCNMFSAISFVQMPPPPPGAEVLDSRANSPPGHVEEDHASSVGNGPGSVPTQIGTVGST